MAKRSLHVLLYTRLSYPLRCKCVSRHESFIGLFLRMNGSRNFASGVTLSM